MFWVIIVNIDDLLIVNKLNWNFKNFFILILSGFKGIMFFYLGIDSFSFS